MILSCWFVDCCTFALEKIFSGLMQLFLQNVWRFRFYVVNLQPETRTRQASRWSLNRRVVFVIVIVPSLLFGGFGRMNSFDKITEKTHYLSLYKFFSIKYCWFSNNICIFALGFGESHFQDILVKTKHWLLFRVHKEKAWETDFFSAEGVIGMLFAVKPLF